MERKDKKADLKAKAFHQLRDALAYAENIIATLREPFIVLDRELRVKSANRRFYETFQVSAEETENRFIYELGNRQWDIPQLRTLLKEVLSNDYPIRDYEIQHKFPIIGRKVMLLNARRFVSRDSGPDLILLAFEDITERKQAEAALTDSERCYRRLFETAQDGILILDARTGKVIDANPYIAGLLGYTREHFLGKELWQLGLFRDIDASRTAYEELQRNGYVRYDHLPLETKGGQRADVEFVSNIYHVDGTKVIQCNIRDITERRQLELAQLKSQALADLNRRKDEFWQCLLMNFAIHSPRS